VERSVRFEQGSRTITLGALRFNLSGWFLVRAISDNPKTFRFASTGPFYVEIGPRKSRISKASAQFFFDWVRERSARVKTHDAQQCDDLLRYHRMAEMLCQDKVTKADAE
jgi:hypothetical protein